MVLTPQEVEPNGGGGGYEFSLDPSLTFGTTLVSQGMANIESKYIALAGEAMKGLGSLPAPFPQPVKRWAWLSAGRCLMAKLCLHATPSRRPPRAPDFTLSENLPLTWWLIS